MQHLPEEWSHRKPVGVLRAHVAHAWLVKASDIGDCAAALRQQRHRPSLASGRLLNQHAGSPLAPAEQPGAMRGPTYAAVGLAVSYAAAKSAASTERARSSPSPR